MKNDISIMHFVFLCLAQDFKPWNDLCKMFPAICALDLTLAIFDSWMYTGPGGSPNLEDPRI